MGVALRIPQKHPIVGTVSTELSKATEYLCQLIGTGEVRNHPLAFLLGWGGQLPCSYGYSAGSGTKCFHMDIQPSLLFSGPPGTPLSEVSGSSHSSVFLEFCSPEQLTSVLLPKLFQFLGFA